MSFHSFLRNFIMSLAILSLTQCSSISPLNSSTEKLAPTAENAHRHSLPTSQPKHIALLLPLSGPLAGPGLAIRDGFMAAHAQGNEENVHVEFYNTASSDVKILYERAVAEGAQYIVGPLTKADVAAVGVMEHPVPTVLLNETAIKPLENAYQFALSPSHEAKQVADHMKKAGLNHVLIIAPLGQWGEEVSSAFTQQFKEMNGQVVDILYYHPHENFNVALRDLLKIKDSELRTQELKKWIGNDVEASPKRRQDMDGIFLLAYPSVARQIMPWLKYYYAGDIPVYATSSIYSGYANALEDRDLNGIIFCDMPWVFTHAKDNKKWPEQYNSYNRLYALGLDSYVLATKLNHLAQSPTATLSSKSGTLYLNSEQQIQRISTWAQFKQGLAQL